MAVSEYHLSEKSLPQKALHALIVSDDRPSDQLLIMPIQSAISPSVCQLLLSGKCKFPPSLAEVSAAPGWTGL